MDTSQEAPIGNCTPLLKQSAMPFGMKGFIVAQEDLCVYT